MVAHHFGEVWNERDCVEMCDICVKQKQTNSIEKDVTQTCKGFIEMLETTDQRMTAAKLVDSWKNSKVARNISKEERPTARQLEYMLALCLMRGVLREEYHFTPYNTISYTVKGARAHAVMNNRLTMQMSVIPDTTSSIRYPMKRKVERGSATTSVPESITQSVGGPMVGSSAAFPKTSNSTGSHKSPVSLSLKRQRSDSCNSGFSEIDEDFLVTPKRANSMLTSKGLLKGGGNGSSRRSKKKSPATSKSQLLFMSSADMKNKSRVISNIRPDSSDIIEINSDSSSE